MIFTSVTVVDGILGWGGMDCKSGNRQSGTPETRPDSSEEGASL